ncbi:zinc-containing alcohol dehydrogenase [Heterostelium album PN500]|uniref:Zinc-containing alcohol dehydrogenase n=1 Tax=Heterostelium pallidum (strain ATCC 26659 / Pp 5 / PN500) TaxID=670386 RepID=D3BV73_HETP5|nr:zinc-containing alcohol dehydrogenase [Heterostelium album PN500]EFA74630.1 zinc-containing alcohol dehydrogenase [Heterostelium album PN500]|eukprot:XP_020426764.1 zinc-containing alcohol dehydrogenase [Heterostelium album PN500]
MDSTMRCARFAQQNGELELAVVPVPKITQTNQVKIKVYSCGVCHSDVLGKYGFPGISWPRIPGHEAVGRVLEVGSAVTRFKVGDKIGVGWFGGHCATCNPCLDNEWVCCQKGQVCGIHYDGGYAEQMIAPEDACALVPEELDFKHSGPLMCAGITVYNSIRQQDIKVGSLVCIQGIGGLGHLAIQFARKMGYEVVAFSGGADKRDLALKLGANHYIDGSQPDAIEQLTKLSPKLIVTTSPSAKAAESLLPALATCGKFLLLAAITDPMNINPLQLLLKKQSIVGFPSGDSRDSEDTLKFAAINNVQAMVEVFPLEKAAEALGKMLENRIRFRGVLSIVPEDQL